MLTLEIRIKAEFAGISSPQYLVSINIGDVNLSSFVRSLGLRFPDKTVVG